MMIKKFKSIENLAVFKNFQWDNSVINSSGTPLECKQVNIIYGQNYSGKTTLSRIVRAFETGYLSDKYISPKFTLTTDSGELTEQDYPLKKLVPRIFNEDFVRDNLKFIIDPNGTIEPFAILGEDNKKIQDQIEAIHKKLGKNDPESPTGLYELQAKANQKYKDAQERTDRERKDLNKKKEQEATDKKRGIKYKSEKYGNQNYNIRDLGCDIETVLKETYQPLSTEEKDSEEKRLNEKVKRPPRKILFPTLKLDQFVNSVKELCSRKIGTSNKIEELLHDVAMESWVHRGLEINKDHRTCAFCGHELTDARWEELYSHFDKDSEKLTQDLEETKKEINEEIEKIKNAFSSYPEEFYMKYSTQISQLQNEYDEKRNLYINSLNGLNGLIDKKAENPYSPIPYTVTISPIDFSSIFKKYNRIREEDIKYSEKISETKKKIQTNLRLNEVFRFCNEINYTEKIKDIRDLETKESQEKEEFDHITGEITKLENQILELNQKLKDEGKGAKKVNDYLNSYLGHHYLSLVCNSKTGAEGEKKVYFDIMRGKERAFNLSEGEKSLIAFCYFIAKLDDINTADKKPIIWIDDPISSLDSNHIYFVYALIKQKILGRNHYEQLFITTHNLLFLKYLGNLYIYDNKKTNLVIERSGTKSSIKLMPKYLSEHGTEFNHWFGCIYKCANENLSDQNLYQFESFSNNARKFFETYLFYRYPDSSDFRLQLKQFFSDDTIFHAVARKLLNEGSHAQGDLENHELPFEEKDIKRIANYMLKRLKEVDQVQYNALLNSIGV